MAGYIGSKASVVSSGAERKKVFDITATTTSLTGCSYTPNQVHVFHNGVRLVDGTDYTATDGSTVTLTTAAQSGDEVVVISYATFQPADAYTKTESDDRFVNDPNAVIAVSGSNVGIGTSSPSSVGGTSLVVHHTSAPRIRMTSDATGQAGTDGAELTVNGSDLVIENRESSANTRFYNGGAERMRIDNAGRVTMPYQVGFKASGLTSAPSPPSIIVYNNVSAKGGFNRGGHYSTSTGRFTAPIAGVYLFSANAMSNSTDGRLMLRIVLNSADAHQGSSSSNSAQYQDSSVTVALYMNANDYVEVKTEGPKGLHGIGQMEYYFTGLLIG